MGQKGLIYMPILILLITGVAIGTAFLVNQNPNQDVKGTLIAHDESDDDSDSSSSSDGGTSRSGGSPTSSPQKTETKIPEGIRTKSETKEDQQKTEIRFSEGEKIKTRVEEGKTRIDVYSAGVKVRYEIRDGRVTIKTETEEGVSVPEQELVKITDRLDKTGIKIATAGGELMVTRNQIGASSNFPLSIDLATNQLIASTSAGTKILTVLPDQAVQNMLAANVISRLSPQAVTAAVQEGEVTTISSIIQLGIRNNIPVYEIPGIRQFNLLGFIPMARPITAIVSAETGQLVTTQQSLFTQVVDLLSP